VHGALARGAAARDLQRLEAVHGRARVALAGEALSLSPLCADAYVILAAETAVSDKERRDLFARGVETGELALGPEGFEEYAGSFWGLLETRPYMRARTGLADALLRLAADKDAWSVFWLYTRALVACREGRCGSRGRARPGCRRPRPRPSSRPDTPPATDGSLPRRCGAQGKCCRLEVSSPAARQGPSVWFRLDPGVEVTRAAIVCAVRCEGTIVHWIEIELHPEEHGYRSLLFMVDGLLLDQAIRDLLRIAAREKGVWPGMDELVAEAGVLDTIGWTHSQTDGKLNGERALDAMRAVITGPNADDEAGPSEPGPITDPEA